MPLPLSSSVVPSYDNFISGSNALTINMVRDFRHRVDASQLYLWGAGHSGKTHLLLAAYNECLSAGVTSFYISLKDDAVSPGLLDGLEGCTLIAIDDVDQVAGDEAWEQAIFNLINFSREQSGKLLFSATSSPAAGQWQLQDLVSRLNWGPVVSLNVLSDRDARAALITSADEKGLEMPDETADYLLNRHTRDVASLLEIVALLDRESLAAGRARITIPFLKACLARQEN